MKFGEAIEALKHGKSVRRTGWNGKGMYIYLEDWTSTGVEYEPTICIFTAQRNHQPGWLASQQDMLAEDWELVEQES